MQPGQRFANRFDIVSPVGTGATGRVFHAMDAETGRDVALKILDAGTPRSRFEREAAVLASLHHPAIVGYVAHAASAKGWWLAMEWIDGESLAARLGRGPFEVADVVALGKRIATGLAAAHDGGVVHRDLKPSNVILANGHHEQPKIIDFGIAYRGPNMTLTTSGDLLGTPGYMAPEQARGDRDVDARADVFSLGCVLFECLTGRPAFAGQHAMALLAKILLEEPPRVRELARVPEPVDDLVGRMLAKHPADRPSDAREVARELEAMEGIAIDPATPQPSERTHAALTAREQRVASVILIGGPESASAPTWVGGKPTYAIADVASLVRAFEARVEPLLDGSVVVHLPHDGLHAPTDRAARAAICAIALRRAMPSAPMALATGRAEERPGRRHPIGDAIDRAAELVSIDSAPSIRVDDVTASLLDERFIRRRDAFGVLVEGRTDRGAFRTLLGKVTPCVGRDKELGDLLSIVTSSVDDPAARAIIVTAPAGIGKSRLRYELLRRLAELDEARDQETFAEPYAGESKALEVWIARGDPIATSSAFGLAAQMIRGTAGVVEGEPHKARREKLRARVARHVAPADQARVTAFLGEMIGAPFPSDADHSLRAARRDAILMGDQIRRAWEDFLSAELARHPLLIVLEDLHWGDLPTVTLVDAALRLFSERSLVVVAFARPEVDALFPNLWDNRNVLRVPLRGLTHAASEELLRTVLGDLATPARLARLARQAEGNAFYLEELARAAADGKEDALPETVLAMVEARLLALGANERRALRAASVFGQVFWSGAVAALLGDDGSHEAERLLDDLVRREIIARRHDGASKFAAQAELTFRHALVREAAYAMLTGEDRAMGHRLAAAWLERSGETDAMTLAEHWARGGAAAAAATAFVRAAEQALEGNDFAGALNRARRGAALLESDTTEAATAAVGRAYVVMAEAHHWRGENLPSAEAATTAMELLPRGSDRYGDAAGWAAIGNARLGAVDRAVAVAEDLCAILTEDPNREPSSGCLHAATRVSGLLIHAARIDLAERLLDLTWSLSPRLPYDPRLRGRLAFMHGLLASQTGDLGAFMDLCRTAVELLEESGDARLAAGAHVNLGFCLSELGAYREAVLALEQCLGSAMRMGLKTIAAVAQNNLGWALARTGRLDEGARVEREAAESFCEQGDRRLEGGSRNYRAAMLAEAGDLDEAEREVEVAIELLSAAPPLRRYAIGTHAKILLLRGRPLDALARAEEAMALLQNVRGVLGEGEAALRLTLAEALTGVGNEERARAVIEEARGRIEEVAKKITDPGLRKSFLENVPEHKKTMTSYW